MTDTQRRITALHYAAACVEQGAENTDALAIGFPQADLLSAKTVLARIAADLRRQADEVAKADSDEGRSDWWTWD